MHAVPHVGAYAVRYLPNMHRILTNIDKYCHLLTETVFFEKGMTTTYKNIKLGAACNYIGEAEALQIQMLAVIII